MRILFFSYAWPNALQPGLGTFNRTMIAGLLPEHQVRVVSPIAWPDRLRSVIRNRGFDRQFIESFEALPGVPATYPTYFYPPKILRTQYGKCLWWSAGKSLLKAIDEFQPDVVLSYWAHPDGEVAVKGAHLRNLPAVCMVGGSDVLLLARHGGRRSAILNVLQQADGVIGVSQHLGEVLKNDGLPMEKFSVVPRGVDPHLFSTGDRSQSRSELKLSSDVPQLISVGRLVPVKGLPDLIAACRILKESGRRFELNLLGSGPLHESLSQQIRESQLNDVVYLRGGQSQADLAKWYRAADLTVLASHSEGIPNVLLESLASGTPFVATNVGGIPEIADPHFDRLVPARNPQQLATAIGEQLDQLMKPANGIHNGTARRFLPIFHTEAAQRLVTALQSAITRKAAGESKAADK